MWPRPSGISSGSTCLFHKQEAQREAARCCNLTERKSGCGCSEHQLPEGLEKNPSRIFLCTSLFSKTQHLLGAVKRDEPPSGPTRCLCHSESIHSASSRRGLLFSRHCTQEWGYNTKTIAGGSTLTLSLWSRQMLLKSSNE